MLRLVGVVLLLGLAAVVASGALDRPLLYPFNPAQSAAPAGMAETLLPTDDGETLVVWTAAPAPGRPTVLYFHGNAGNLAVRAGRFAAFTKRGFGVVAAGYRGSSGSTGAPSETALIADAALLRSTLAQFVGQGPVIYYGESLGAAVAIALAVTDPPAALVLEAPFASLAEMSAALYGSPALARLLRSEWPSRERIADVAAPLLVLHGAEDPLVPPAQGRALFEAARSADKTFYAVPGARHIDVWQPDAQRRLIAFLNRF